MVKKISRRRKKVPKKMKGGATHQSSEEYFGNEYRNLVAKRSDIKTKIDSIEPYLKSVSDKLNEIKDIHAPCEDGSYIQTIQRQFGVGGVKLDTIKTYCKHVKNARDNTVLQLGDTLYPIIDTIKSNRKKSMRAKATDVGWVSHSKRLEMAREFSGSSKTIKKKQSRKKKKTKKSHTKSRKQKKSKKKSKKRSKKRRSGRK